MEYIALNTINARFVNKIKNDVIRIFDDFMKIIYSPRLIRSQRMNYDERYRVKNLCEQLGAITDSFETGMDIIEPKALSQI
jgi:hypothetical protein